MVNGGCNDGIIAYSSFRSRSTGFPAVSVYQVTGIGIEWTSMRHCMEALFVIARCYLSVHEQPLAADEHSAKSSWCKRAPGQQCLTAKGGQGHAFY